MTKRYVRGKDHPQYKHGLCGTKIRNIWSSMMQRCYNRRAVAFPDYGGRGIRVAARWHDLVKFVSYVGGPPTTRHTLDRVDNDGDYCPGNVRWATRREQAENRRNTRLVTFRGKTMSPAAWARETGLSYYTLYFRLFRRRWTIAKALTEPWKGSRP